jgi:hypothetical protein
MPKFKCMACKRKNWDKEYGFAPKFDCVNTDLGSDGKNIIWAEKSAANGGNTTKWKNRSDRFLIRKS